MIKLNDLVRLSRFYGSNSDYVIAGGGNTSYKDDHELYVKASGVSLATIGPEGFVRLSREKLEEMESKHYPEDAVKREEAVKKDLKEASLSPESMRPSVETSLHNLIKYRYVVHTHPTLVNALMCATHAREEVRSRFGIEALYVEYTDPGYVLFKKLRTMISQYVDRFGTPPQIIFLQNHGIFVGANTASEIRALYDSIMSGIVAGCDMDLPDCSTKEFQSGISRVVSGVFEERGLKVKAFQSALGEYFSDRSLFTKISRPFTPDIIVYCKSNYLFLEQDLEEEEIRKKLSEFEASFGYDPKVIMEENRGLILVEESEKSISTVLEVFQDMMKIAYLSEQFGGPHAMSADQIDFIDNWEVENYRRAVARK